MKTLIASFLALLLGLAAGWYFEHQHAELKVTDAVEQMQQRIDSADREHAARAVRAIQMIESGESSNAVRLLSRPIVDFYQFHASLTHNDKLTRDVLALIEQLADTNTLIAHEIHAKIQ